MLELFFSQYLSWIILAAVGFAFKSYLEYSREEAVKLKVKPIKRINDYLMGDNERKSKKIDELEKRITELESIIKDRILQ